MLVVFWGLGGGPRPRKDTLLSKMRDEKLDKMMILSWHMENSRQEEREKKGGPVKGNEG
jgi:hypothetical protein